MEPWVWKAGGIAAHNTSLPDPASPIVLPERPLAVVAGLVAVLLIVAGDVALGPGLQITGVLTCPPFIPAAFVNPRRTAMVGLVSILANVLLAGQAHVLMSGSQLIRMSAVVAAAVGAVLLCVVRERDQRQALTLAHIAEVAQLAVLRVVPPTVGPAAVRVRYVSASAEARVGGDFYEALHTEHGMRAVVGDVRGKGLGSVQLANVLIGSFRGADHGALSLVQLAHGLDAAFTRFEPSDEDFATAVLIELAPGGRLTVVNCGHPAPFLLRDGQVEAIAPPRPTPPLGLGSRPEPCSIDLGPADRVLLYTDGMLEARRGGQTFDALGAVREAGADDFDVALDRLVSDLERFVGGHIRDDVALMLVQLR